MTEKATAPNTNVSYADIRSSDDAPEGLKQIYDALVDKAERAMEWYESRQQSKKKGALSCCVSAVVLGAVTAIIPSVIAFLPEHVSLGPFQNFAVVRLNPIATIAGVVAATLILMDKFYGYSSSWMRFVTTYQEIQTNLEDFRINWRKQILKLNANQPPTDEQIIAVYDFLGSFLKSVNDSIKNETQGWVNEFKGALAEIDKTVELQKTAAAALTTTMAKGTIELSLEDSGELDENKWTVQLDNRKEEEKVGQRSAVITQLEPGIYRVRIAASRNAHVVAAEHSVIVKAGETTPVRVTKLG
jgi:ABC-type multidrug transport system fused ATPase/permease subunit